MILHSLYLEYDRAHFPSHSGWLGGELPSFYLSYPETKAHNNKRKESERLLGTLCLAEYTRPKDPEASYRQFALTL
jgi:hypothetical protein